MMSLSYGLCILTILLIVPGSYSLIRKDFSICDQNSPHIFNNWGFIGLNHRKLNVMSHCMLTLKSSKPIYFFVTEKSNSSQCYFDKLENCPCDAGYQDFYCNEMCTPLILKGNRYRYKENNLKSTIFVPPHPNTCQFSVMDVDINICESKIIYLNINLSYITTDVEDVDNSIIFNTYKPVINTFPNFTMCNVITRKTVLPLGTKGVIHLSECSGSCSLELTACTHCRIHFYSNNIYEPCLTVKIADTHIKPVAGVLEVNFTTASYNAVLQICQYYLHSKHEIYYSVIENIENITLSSDEDFHLSFPLKAETNDEILKYHIESSDPSRSIQIVFPDFLLCSKCSITIQVDNSTINRTINNQDRVYRFKSAELIFSTTSRNTSRIGFNCSLSLVKDHYPALIYSTCSEYRKVSSAGTIYFGSTGSYPSYDCVWVLQSHVKLMKVNISSFHLTYNKNLFIHSGTSYSGSSLINDMEVHNTGSYTMEMHFLVRALYIRIKGSIKQGSRLILQYIPGGCTDDDRWFRCPFSQFIPSSQYCDGHNDCSDSSDETDCSSIVGGGCTDADRWFRCPFAQFIPGHKRCDGRHHCFDSSDEKNCKISGGHCTKADQWFQCGDNIFIPSTKRCNGHIDCPGAPDERHCNGGRCSDGDQWFQCGGQFIPSYQHCDGHPDCYDSSDEMNCNNIVEGELFDWKDWFRCPNGRLIRSDLRCNGLSDCSDSSDERDCNTVRGSKDTFNLGIKIVIVIGILFIVLIICMVFILYYLCWKKAQVTRTERQTHVSDFNGINSTTSTIANDGIDFPAHQEGRRSPPPAYEEISADSIVQGNLNTTFTNPESDPNNAMEMLPTYDKYMQELYDSNLPRNITETSGITDNSVHQTNGSSHNQDSNVDEATRY